VSVFKTKAKWAMLLFFEEASPIFGLGRVIEKNNANGFD